MPFSAENEICYIYLVHNKENCCKVLLLTIFLTHCGLVMPYGDIDQEQNWLR